MYQPRLCAKACPIVAIEVKEYIDDGGIKSKRVEIIEGFVLAAASKQLKSIFLDKLISKAVK